MLDWSAAQYEELQLHAIATLATVAPLLIEDYISCSGNIRLLLFLEWCTGNGEWTQYNYFLIILETTKCTTELNLHPL